MGISTQLKHTCFMLSNYQVNTDLPAGCVFYPSLRVSASNSVTFLW